MSLSILPLTPEQWNDDEKSLIDNFKNGLIGVLKKMSPNALNVQEILDELKKTPELPTSCTRTRFIDIVVSLLNSLVKEKQIEKKNSNGTNYFRIIEN